MQLLQHFKESLSDWNYIFRSELFSIFKDPGVLMFCIVVPLAYPLLYASIYNEEVVREVPAVVVDDCHNAFSREFLRKVDATPDVSIVAVVPEMEQARSLVKHREAYGIIRIPASFHTDVMRMQQTQVSIYADMSGMLYYKALLLSCTEASLDMNARIKVARAPGSTDRVDAITEHPIAYEQVDIYNPQAGFASFLIPAVLMLILQQTLVLGVGLSAGTARERNSYGELVPIDRHYHGLLRVVLGKAAAYIAIYLFCVFYLLFVVPKIFSLPQIGNPFDVLNIAVPYLLSCVFFAITLSVLIPQREACFMIVVFASVPLLFLSGISWPGHAMPRFWEHASWLFPSTFGVNAYIKVNNMGAPMAAVRTEWLCLWVQAAVYFGTALLFYVLNMRGARRRYAQKKRRLLENKRRKAGRAEGGEPAAVIS